VDWRGVAAVLLVVGVFAVLLAATIFAGVNHDREVTTDEVATVATVLGAALGAVATYLGTKTGGKGKDDDSTGA
jgi:hypothetical protein